jgi:RimJ/RimL family protein N-acetyltransferase
VRRVIKETQRLILREWGEGDADRFYEVMNTPAVMRHLGGVQDRSVWEAAVARIFGFQRDYGHTFWLVERKSDGELLGFCGLKRVNAGGTNLTGQFEIGWRLRESAWGQGYAKEAAVASLDLAFFTFGAPHVVALTIGPNAESQGLMKRLGMVRREDLDFDDPRFGPELNPTIVFRIDAADWTRARKAALTSAPAGFSVDRSKPPVAR